MCLFVHLYLKIQSLVLQTCFPKSIGSWSLNGKLQKKKTEYNLKMKKKKMNSNSLRLQWFLNFEMKRRLFIHKILKRWHLGRLANKLLWPTCTGWPDRCGWCVQDKFRIWCLCFNWILSVGHSARKLIFTVERTSARNAECLTYKSAEWCWEFRDCQSDDQGANSYLSKHQNSLFK